MPSATPFFHTPWIVCSSSRNVFVDIVDMASARSSVESLETSTSAIAADSCLLLSDAEAEALRLVMLRRVR